MKIKNILVSQPKPLDLEKSPYGDLALKYKLNIEFYKFIAHKKLKFYNKQQRKKLLDKYENAIKRIRKIYLSEWLLIFFCYLKYFDSYSLKKVLKRFIKSILKYE